MSSSAPAPASHEVAVVRQPIADAARNVVGYELLFGGELRKASTPAQEAIATSALLVEAFGEIGLEQLSGARPVWVSVARNFLLEIGPPPMRPDRAVLQVAAYPAEDDLLAALQHLSRSGYTLALDGFDGRADLTELLALCPIVKVAVEGRTDAELAQILAHPLALGATLVAVGVETHEDFERCKRLGFAQFQGAFLARPRVITHRSVATAGIGSLRQLNELTAGDVSFEDLERIIASDVGLSIKLLRYVNSAFFALPREIGSVREALALLGVRTVRRWAMVIAMSAIPDAPNELLELALQRARLCEVLGGGNTAEERESCFTVGLFSVADALCAAPMEDVLEGLPFSDEIRAALLRHEGPKGQLLDRLIAYENGEFPDLPPLAEGAEVISIAGAYRQSLEWAESARRAVA